MVVFRLFLGADEPPAVAPVEGRRPEGRLREAEWKLEWSLRLPPELAPPRPPRPDLPEAPNIRLGLRLKRIEDGDATAGVIITTGICNLGIFMFLPYIFVIYTCVYVFSILFFQSK